MKKLLLLLLLPILSFGQNCAPTLIVKDTCSYGYAKTFVEWEELDSGCVIQAYHQGNPYNTGSYGWNNQLSTNHVFYNNYSPGDPFASSDGFWFLLEMQDGSFTDTVFASEFTCISGCMDASYDNYNPVANVPANCLAMPPPQDYCPDSTKTSITIELTPDTYAGETSLDIINQNGDTLLNIAQGFFQSIGTGNSYANTLCVPIGDTIKFYIYDSYGDGICGSCFGGVDGNVLVKDECGDVIYSLLPGDNLNFGDVDSSEAFVTKDCSYEPTYGCPDPAYLEFNPNADYLDPLLCITLKVPGCMDTTMFDFDSTANVPLMWDSCNYTLNLIDGGGDGWLGAYVVVSQLGNTFGPYTNTNSFVETVSLNLKSNHPVTIRAYSQTSSDATLTQVGFELVNPEGSIVISGGTNPWNDKIKIFPKKYIALPDCPTICDPYVYGCMDALAYNYDLTANADTGCYYNPGCTSPAYLDYHVDTANNIYRDYHVQDSCVGGLVVFGCTDFLAFNYNSTANMDNGGCMPVILGCMQPIAFNYEPLANMPDTCVAVVEGCMSSIALNYDLLANTDDGSCIGIVYGCIDTLAFNYAPLANVSDGSCIPVVYGCVNPIMFNFDSIANTNDGTCIPFIYGCTDPVMFNYNPLANANNSSCIPFIFGCTDPSMLNYDPLSNTEDFSCIEFIYGCMEETALNYDPLANTENQSCITIIEGCMDLNAYNYSVEANVSDNNCLYAASCITGPGLPYWLNDPCYAWVISVDDYCCENEWDDVCQLTYSYCDSSYVGGIPARLTLEEVIVVYPNPASTTININKNVDINVLNYIGDIIISKTNISSLDVSELSSGLYMLQINYNNKTITKQLIKK